MPHRCGSRGEFELPPLDDAGQPLTPAQEAAMIKPQGERRLEEIRNRYTRRMHDLREFRKSLLERFAKWFNRTHSRSGHLWEDRFKSVIVESGVAARTVAAYIDLNPRSVSSKYCLKDLSNGCRTKKLA